MKNDVLNKLFELADNDYKEFTTKICYTGKSYIGVRLPYLRQLSKTIDYKEYLKIDDEYFEETMLKGMVIGNIKDIDESIIYIKEFIPKINNWSVCDSFCASLKVTKKNKEKMLEFIEQYKYSHKEFEIRFVIVMLLDFYIEDKYINKIFDIIELVDKETYYVKMAVAWLLSVCYIKCEKETYNYLKNTNLDHFTYKKTISKINDSFRVSKESKEILKTIRREI